MPTNRCYSLAVPSTEISGRAPNCMRTFSVFPSNVFLELVPRAVRAKREKILRLSPRGVFQVPSWDLYHPASSRKPDGATAPGLPVLDSMSDNLKANGAKQRRVFVGVQAGMIKRVAPIRPDAFAMGWPAVKHQHSGGRGMSSEHVEHPALVIWREVKETIPSEYTVESAAEL